MVIADNEINVVIYLSVIMGTGLSAAIVLMAAKMKSKK